MWGGGGVSGGMEGFSGWGEGRGGGGGVEDEGWDGGGGVEWEGWGGGGGIWGAAICIFMLPEFLVDSITEAR